jgi:replicative DNA helicase
MTDATPPNNIDAEQAVLGAMLLDPGCAGSVSWLRPAAFYRSAHRIIYGVMISMAEAGDRIDLVTLIQGLRSSGALEKVGGEAYIAALLDATPSSTGIGHHAAIVRDQAMLRDIVDVSRESIDQVAAGVPDVPAFAAQVERALCEISAERHGRRIGFRPLEDLVGDAFSEIEAAYEGPDGLGVTSGIEGLDRLTGGFFAGQLIVIGGRPGMGKTALAVRLALNMAESGRRVAFFSLEMSANEIVQRFLSLISGVPLIDIRTGRLDSASFQALTRASESIGRLGVHVLASDGLRPPEAASALRRMRSEAGALDAVVIDYLQLMQSGAGRENRTQEISEITRALKGLAVEFQAPLILLSQLSRRTEGRDNPRPICSDLRDSGSIEQDADLVLFPYRPEVYTREASDAGTADLIIGKQRNGPAGESIPLHWDNRTAGFSAG